MITIVSGQARSGTSLTMQMLQRAGYPLFWDRMPNCTPINPRGHYELSNQWGFTPADLNKFEEHVVKIFPTRWENLTDDHAYRMIYLDRDVESIAQSQTVMFHEEARGDEIIGLTHEDMVRDAIHWRQWALDYLPSFPDRTVLQFSDLFTGAAQEQLGVYLGSTPEQIEAMKSCVEPELRHFVGQGECRQRGHFVPHVKNDTCRDWKPV